VRHLTGSAAAQAPHSTMDIPPNQPEQNFGGTTTCVALTKVWL
jgi:hypothetical protein